MTEEKRTRVHTQVVTISFSALDEDIVALDNLNARIKKFVLEDIVEENDLTGLYNNVALSAESEHEDLDLLDEEWDALASGEEWGDVVKSDEGLPLPLPKNGKEYLN